MEVRLGVGSVLKNVGVKLLISFLHGPHIVQLERELGCLGEKSSIEVRLMDRRHERGDHILFHELVPVHIRKVSVLLQRLNSLLRP